MQRPRVMLHARASLLLLVVAGCGGSPGTGDPVDAASAIDAPPATDAPPASCPATGRYLSLRTGKSWTYKITDTGSGAVTSKTQTVGPLEDLSSVHAGVMAYKLTTTKPGGFTDSWQQDTGTAIHRHLENDNAGATTTSERYDPYRTRVDELAAHVTAGASWSESYTEYVTVTGMPQTTASKVEQWSVVAVDEQLTVPAGTFCALHIHRTSTVGGTPGSDKQYWFARGVGKIKEEGGGQIEELSSYVP